MGPAPLSSDRFRRPAEAVVGFPEAARDLAKSYRRSPEVFDGSQEVVRHSAERLPSNGGRHPPITRRDPPIAGSRPGYGGVDT